MGVGEAGVGERIHSALWADRRRQGLPGQPPPPSTSEWWSPGQPLPDFQFDFAQTLADSNFPAEIALDGNCRHLRAEAVCIIFGKIVDLCVPTDSCLVANALRCDPTDAINRSQGDLDVFMSG